MRKKRVPCHCGIGWVDVPAGSELFWQFTFCATGASECERLRIEPYQKIHMETSLNFDVIARGVFGWISIWFLQESSTNTEVDSHMGSYGNLHHTKSLRESIVYFYNDWIPLGSLGITMDSYGFPPKSYIDFFDREVRKCVRFH